MRVFPSKIIATSLAPFGMVMKERSWQATSTDKYRFSFNGKEKDDEVNVDGGTIAFEARIYDSRICRFLSCDPLEAEYAWQSTYVFAGNSPINLIDELGEGPRLNRKNRSIKTHIKVYNDGSFNEEDLVKIRQSIVNGLETNKIGECVTIQFTNSKGGLFGTGLFAGWFSKNVYVYNTDRRSHARKNGNKIWLNSTNYDESTPWHEFCHLLGLSDRYSFVAKYQKFHRPKDIPNPEQNDRKYQLTNVYDAPMGKEQVKNDKEYDPQSNSMSSDSYNLTPFQSNLIFSVKGMVFGEKNYKQILAFQLNSTSDFKDVSLVNGLAYANSGTNCVDHVSANGIDKKDFIPKGTGKQTYNSLHSDNKEQIRNYVETGRK